ncbi:MAG: membrane protein insertase YidC [Nocardioidaceae bacterium]
MFGLLGQILHAVLAPLYYAVSVILVGFHWLFSNVMDPNSGWTWGLSIVGLTVVIRTLLIPLFVKQIKTSRNMQLLQPKIKELQKKYGHDRERMAQETMKLYQDTGTNPFASCLPLLMQAPVLYALFHVLRTAAKDSAIGVLTQGQARSLADGQIFGARIADTFTGAESVHVQVLTAVLVVIMTATTFTTQRQLMAKNMPESAMSGPYAQQQKMLLYVLPLVFAIGGIAFPIGVLLYWTTSNLWTMGQQFYVIRNNPAPGTPALRAKEERDARKAQRHTTDGTGPVQDAAPIPIDPPRQRVQPKKVPRSKRRSGSTGSSKPTGSPKRRGDDADASSA